MSYTYYSPPPPSPRPSPPLLPCISKPTPNSGKPKPPHHHKRHYHTHHVPPSPPHHRIDPPLLPVSPPTHHHHNHHPPPAPCVFPPTNRVPPPSTPQKHNVAPPTPAKTSSPPYQYVSPPPRHPSNRPPYPHRPTLPPPYSDKPTLKSPPPSPEHVYYSKPPPLYPSPVPPMISYNVPPVPYAITPPTSIDDVTSPPAGSGGGHNHTGVIVACVSLGGVFFLAFLAIGLFCLAKKKKKPNFIPVLPPPVACVEEHEVIHETVIQGPHGEQAVDDVRVTTDHGLPPAPPGHPYSGAGPIGAAPPYGQGSERIEPPRLAVDHPPPHHEKIIR